MRLDGRQTRTAGAVRFGVFEVDLEARELRRNGIKVKLQGQPFQILALLITRPGQLLTREELQVQLWQGNSVVDPELGLNTAIKKIRTALGDSADNPRFVETLAKRGYRFISPVQEIERHAVGNSHGPETSVLTAISFQNGPRQLSSPEPASPGTQVRGENEHLKSANGTRGVTGELFQAIARTSRPKTGWYYWAFSLLLITVGLAVVVRRIDAHKVRSSAVAPASSFRAIYGATHPGLGIGGYDLKSTDDRLLAFDYDHSGKQDYLVLYRPGGYVWIVKNSEGTFSSVYMGNGIGGYNLKSPNDHMFAFDFEHSGKLDYLVLYQTGSLTLRILKNDGDGIFTPVYAHSQGGPIGLGASNLKSIDRAFAFDYDHSGKLDHLVLYNRDIGTVRILKNSGGSLVWVYPKGVSGSLQSRGEFSDCKVFAFDYDHSGKLDHLILYRPGMGTISILKHSETALVPVYQGKGIGGYDLMSPVDRVLAFDYDHSGKLDYLMLYRPGTGMVRILKNSGGAFSPVYQGKGIGGYDLNSPKDRIMAFDYDRIARLDHLLLYRPSTGIVYILEKF